MSKFVLVDETEIKISDSYSIIDDAYEFETSVSDYEALETLSSKLTDTNLAKVKVIDPLESETEYKNFTKATPVFSVVSENNYELVVIFRLKQKSEQEEQIDTIIDVAQSFDDEEALAVKSIYPIWSTLVGKTVAINTKCVWYDVLYKTRQDNLLIQKHQEPGMVGMESLYECIDETHEGTYEDPIPYAGNMTLEQGKFYIQDDVIYICTYGTGNAVYDRLEYLLTFCTPYIPADGTLEDPIQWFGGGLPINEGKYYIQDNVIYVGIADSGIPVFGNLSELATYVMEYNPEPTVVPGDTPDHPIPYIGTSIYLYEGKYYEQDGVVYICFKTTDVAVTAPLNTLTDNVKVYDPDEDVTEPEEPDTEEPGGEVTEPEQPEPGTGGDSDGGGEDGELEDPSKEPGTLENPIQWTIGDKLYNGTYYIDNGVTYLCIRDSGIEMHYNLADLISGGFVQVVE